MSDSSTNAPTAPAPDTTSSIPVLEDNPSYTTLAGWITDFSAALSGFHNFSDSASSTMELRRTLQLLHDIKSDLPKGGDEGLLVADSQTLARCKDLGRACTEHLSKSGMITS